MLKMKNKLAAAVLAVVVAWQAIPINALAAKAPAKNVIVLMMDGTGSTHTTLARWYKEAPLALDEMVAGAVRTYGAETFITDSAPAATAFATGYKTSDKFIGVLPDGVTMPGVPKPSDDRKTKPVATVLEGAKLAGKSVGLVATSNIQHASPAGYSAHWPERSNYNEIGEQQVYGNIDVVFGAGSKYLIPKDQGGDRVDGENLLDVLKGKGYALVETREQMMQNTHPKVWGLFADSDMAYEFDRQILKPEQPSLAEMTAKAISYLSTNKKGFFLFVEGSKVDWASHANDPIGVISDVLAFDEAVRVALDYAKKDGTTLVLAFSDHGNGGMSIGNKSTDNTYSKLPLSRLIAPLKKASLTGEGVEQVLAGNRGETTIRTVVAEYYGVDDLTSEEVTVIQKATKGSLNYVLGPIISKRSVIGWTTTGHSGEDLFMYSYGPNRPVGLLENTDIARISAESLGFKLPEVDSKLFVDAEAAFSKLGAKVTIDRTDEKNQVLVAETDRLKAELPLSKNLMKLNGKTYELHGIVVLAPRTGKVYLPQQAADIFAANMR